MSTQKATGPLRRIVDELIPATTVYGRRKVRLECGHEVWCSSAAIYRARCRHCRRTQEEAVNTQVAALSQVEQGSKV